MIFEDYLIKPAGFTMIEERKDGFMVTGKIHGKYYSVISSISLEQDKYHWHHVSVSHRVNFPNYKVMKYLKACFMDHSKDAVEVHARAGNHVNINPNCRHLWMNLEKELLPDFTHGSGSI